MSETHTLLRVQEVSKEFPGVLALDKVSFSLAKGEVHALVGENGAGKSTLMQILAGVYTRDGGTVEIDGVPQSYGSKKEAEQAGISIVFQESSLLQNLTVLENLFDGDPPTNRFGCIDRKAMEKKAEWLLNQLGLGISPATAVGSLSVATQKMVEIARALSKEFKILLLDEPTASITVEETDQLFNLIAALKAQGKSIIYISHRIEEIKRIADRVTVLKDGRYVGTFRVGDVTEAQICERMVGRELLSYSYRGYAREKVILEVNHLTGRNFSDVSFRLKEGEMLTVTGLTGAGRTELALSLFGAYKITSGQVRIDGSPVQFRNPGQAMRAGIGYVSEDRKKLGLFMSMSVCENMQAGNIDTINSGLSVAQGATRDMCRRIIEEFSIRCSGPDQVIHNLSGGNQQKVCLARWFTYRPRILIVDEPTLGVDVGSKEEIYTKLSELAAAGIAIIMISSDMIETLSMGDRIMVMHTGSVMKIDKRKNWKEESVVALASGIKE